MEMADRALGRENIHVYNEFSAAAVVQTQSKLRASLPAGAILVMCHPELPYMGAFFCLFGSQFLLTEVLSRVSESSR